MARIFRFSAALLAVTLQSLLAVPGHAQTPGQNINMVSGTQWPGGDPFLQRQNEPCIAVSSRNGRNLIGGANDYRTVDIPFDDKVPGSLAGDAWLGVFKSFDGGLTWQSTLLPGYPQDGSPEGIASPLKGLTTAADPTCRPGTHGLFYYSGIAFNRGTNIGTVFVARFMDLGNKENGDVTTNRDPIRYVDTVVVDSGTSGQFLDKPWIAVDIPRAGAATCSIPVSPTQSVPAGNVYMVWSRFTGSTSTKIMFSRSLDCGKTWSNPSKLSESNSINQGTVLAVDPISGNIAIVWRRFSSSSQPNAIVAAYSADFGKTFSKAVEVAQFQPFDQGTTNTSFRTSALPTLAISVDANNVSRIHAAWAARTAPNNEARIMMSTSLDGSAWSTPAVVDAGPIVDDFGQPFDRGHQFMPQLTFSAGRLMLLYYDSRLTHTVGLFQPNSNSQFAFVQDDEGNFYREKRDPRGELLSDPSKVYQPYVDDAGLTQRRRTLDLRVAQTIPGPALTFTHATVTKYRYGIRGDGLDVAGYLSQMQVNPPNLPMFQSGTVPFMGDYIDIMGQTFLPPVTAGGPWRYNLSLSDSSVHYAVWTSNQDVRPPRDGDWTHYTPVGGGGVSVLDPTKNSPTCVSGQEGMRNQNIYVSAITQGLIVTAPQPSKPLSATLRRAFPILVQNSTSQNRFFRITVANQPQGGIASLLPFTSPSDPAQTSLEVSIAAGMGASRTVFATSSNATATITVNVAEITAPTSSAPVVPNGLTGSVLLNAEGTVTALLNPDGADPSQDISVVEVYNPSISNPNISNPNISNPNISNPNISNPNISNPNISNPDIADPNISNPNISNPNISNPNISNPSISNPNISNATVTDATYTISNTGNTSASYTVKLVGNNTATTASANLQLIVSKTYSNPISVNCALIQDQVNPAISNVLNPTILSPNNLTDPLLNDPSFSNPTFVLKPGETALVTLRGEIDPSAMQNITGQIAPAVVAQAANTGAPLNSYAIPLIILAGTMPNGTAGVPYSGQLQAVGGAASKTWQIISGFLPPGLSLDPITGSVTGTPTDAGSFDFTAQVTDSSTPPQSKSQSFTVVIVKAATATSITSVTPAGTSVVGEPVTVNFSVTVTAAGGGSAIGSVVVNSGDGGQCVATVAQGNCTLIPQTSGAKTLTATFQDNSSYGGSSASVAHQVNTATSTVNVITNLSVPSVVGEPVTVNISVDPQYPNAAPPTGTITVDDGTGVSCTGTVSSGGCALTSATAGTKQITVDYSGDSNYSGSTTGPITHVVGPATTTVAIGGTSPNPSVTGQNVSVAFSVSVVAPGAGTPTGSVTISNGSGATCTATVAAGACILSFSSVGAQSLTATYSGDANFTGNASAAFPHIVNQGNSSVTVVSDLPDPSLVGQAYTVSFSVSAVAPAIGTPSGTVTISDGSYSCSATVAAGSCLIVSTTAGAKNLTAAYSGDASFTPSNGGATHTVGKAGTTTTMLSDSPDPTTPGQSFTVTFAVAVLAPGAGNPTGTVTVSGGGASCSATLPATSCTMALTASGTVTLTAAYSGDSNFNGSSGTTSHTQAPFTFVGFFSPLTTAGTYTNPTFSGTFNKGKAVPIKFQLKDSSGNNVIDLRAVTLIQAVINTACSGAPNGAALILYSPTAGATGGSTFRVDSSSGQYIFNWDTSSVAASGAGCYTLAVTMSDASIRATNIKLK